MRLSSDIQCGVVTLMTEVRRQRMRILYILRIGLGVLFTVCAMAVYAAENTVPPGTGTFASAVASASNGDTLILQEGGYYGDVSVDKSLLIRAQGRLTNAVVAGAFEVRGAGIEVTVQGLTFSQTSQIWQAAAVRLLQNHWTTGSIDLTNYQTAEGDGSLVVIGNTISMGNISTVQSENAYVAGNVLLQGGILTAASAWIVGNYIKNNVMGIDASGTGTSARIIGNRLFCHNVCIRSSAPTSIIQNNLLEMSVDTNLVYYGIEAGNNVAIVNNTIRVSGSPASYPQYHIGITCGNAGIISGNIVVAPGQAYPIQYCSPQAIETRNNLCFSSAKACPAGNENLNAVDPQFVDLVDYRLSPTSPAIDAGPSDFELADLDRSRNDMGVYGGPWSIGQYDVQRDSSNYAPYVYPLFKGGAAFSGGTLDVQALGVAKLR